jgi:hypothetical protein
MTFKTALLAGAAALALLTFSAPANADENDETRELNLQQLDNPGSTAGYDDADDDDGDDAAGDDDGDDGDEGVGALGDDDGDDDGDEGE